MSIAKVLQRNNVKIIIMARMARSLPVYRCLALWQQNFEYSSSKIKPELIIPLLGSSVQCAQFVRVLGAALISLSSFKYFMRYVNISTKSLTRTKIRKFITLLKVGLFGLLSNTNFSTDLTSEYISQ